MGKGVKKSLFFLGRLFPLFTTSYKEVLKKLKLGRACIACPPPSPEHLENPPKIASMTKIPCIKLFLPLYTAWLEGRKPQCACTMSDDDEDCGWICIHHRAEDDDCFCQEAFKCQTCLYQQMGELLKDAHDELSPEEKASLVGRTAEEICQDETNTKMLAVVLSMTVLLLKRQDIAQTGPWEVYGKVDDSQKVIDEVVALLWFPIVRGRMPCELKGCNCMLNPMGKFIAPFMELDPDRFIAMAEEEQKRGGCRGLNAEEAEGVDQE